MDVTKIRKQERDAQHLDLLMRRLARSPRLSHFAEIGQHHALRIAVVSLADTLNFGFVADPTLLPDVDSLAEDVQAEASALTARLLQP